MPQKTIHLSLITFTMKNLETSNTHTHTERNKLFSIRCLVDYILCIHAKTLYMKPVKKNLQTYTLVLLQLYSLKGEIIQMMYRMSCKICQRNYVVTIREIVVYYVRA